MSSGGVVGQLFVLFGLKHNKEQFAAATHALHTLRAAASVTHIAGLAQGLLHMAGEAAESATHIHSLSQAMGMSMNMTQKWTYIAEQSGSNLKEMSVGVSMWLGNLKKLADGTASKSLRRVFKEIGIDQKAAAKAMTSTDGVVPTLMTASATFQRLGNVGMTAVLARMGMGARAGRALAADLIRGPENIKAMFKNLEEKGGVVSDQSLTNLQNLYDTLNDVKKAWHGVFSEVVGALAPALIKVLNRLSSWFAENRDVIGEVLTVAFKALAIALDALITIVDGVAEVFRRAFSGDLGAQALLLTVAGVILYAAVPALIALGEAALVAMAPFLVPTLIIAGLALLVVVIHEYWDEIADFFIGIGNSIVDAFVAIGSGIWAVFSGIGSVVLAILVGIGDGISWLANLITDFITGAGEFFAELGADIWSALGEPWALIQAVAAPVLDFLDARLENLKWLIDAISDFFGFETIQPPGPTAGTTLNLPTLPTESERQMAARMPMFNTLGARTQESSAMATAPPGSAAAIANNTPRGPTSVSVGPTTITINGVKDAGEAKDSIADSIDGVHRHALAAAGGEIE